MSDDMEAKICQSCGMPMMADEDHGTNEDGTKNEEYCKFCFQNGKFEDQGITMEEKIAKNIDIAVKMGMDEDEAKKMAQDAIPKLKRWQNDQ